ncbi:hypothetical protein LTR62_006694 [Meristemomyces frigidus]|uniref:Protein kinase domain-containing protein n=1 Tax=Meristemomyces frigidus TaxID=1508187 RepID=A0AAN7YTB9_9PEZI|nr:hypothetical protein LTR62_006694 [Meristemomyces frigidus]
MDVATRLQTRVRAQSYLDMERNAMPDDSEGDSTESRTRRKFQRTIAADSDSNNNNGFRKPSIPASATRPAGLEHRPSLVNRRRSTFRENVRVPSGPREFPNPGKRCVDGRHRGHEIRHDSGDGVDISRRLASTTSTHPAPSTVGEATNTKQSPFLPHSNSDSFLANAKVSQMSQAENGPFSFGNSNRKSSTDETDSPITPAGRGSHDFEFVPTMNFDDFQSSISDPNWTSPLLSEFPTHVGGRALPKEQVKSRASGAVATANMRRPGMSKQENMQTEEGVAVRSASFRWRTAATPTDKHLPGFNAAITMQPPTSASQPNLSLRTRRQSTMPQSSMTALPATAAAGSRTPRKSVGPGLLNMSDGRKGSVQLPMQSGEAGIKSAMSRTSSLSAKARRTTLGPTPGVVGDAPKASTLMAPTQSRANKVKSLQPPPRQQNTDRDTPNSGRGVSKANQYRAQTPSSSGNKRQSTASGRASGLGARTISPTDARRLKRMSMMQAPPMPTCLPKGPPTPSDELQQNPWVKPELPRLAQPSPSLIPRKMCTDTPISARASPERNFYNNFSSATPTMMGGGVPLSAKSSYQSFASAAGSISTSRLPTPKPRNVHSSSARYDESDFGLVPPVPAIPKAYESPREYEEPFFSTSEIMGERTMDGLEFAFEGSGSPAPATGLQRVHLEQTPRGSIDTERSHELPRKISGEQMRGKHQHKRSTTIAHAGLTTAAKSSRQQPDQAGRKNTNLQPLRLPPLNLMPINTPTSNRIAGFPRPSDEVDGRDEYNNVQTPEPRRTTKTPSTPMTASKATFFRRQDEAMAAKVRSASSHYTLRDLQMDHTDVNSRSFLDDSDVETAGISIPKVQKQRNAITPFASGSLPKVSGETARMRGRPSGEFVGAETIDFGPFDHLMYQNAGKPLGPRPKTSGTSGSGGGKKEGTLSSTESPIAEQAPQLVAAAPDMKKESTSGGLRRKLSLGWRRSSSKAAGHPENNSNNNKSSPLTGGEGTGGAGSREPAKLQKRQSEMPPPKLPASAAWNRGGLSLGPEQERPSLDGGRRKSGMLGNVVDVEHQLAPALAKTRALHSEHPQPVMPPPPAPPPPAPPPAAHRSSSWAASNAPAATVAQHGNHGHNTINHLGSIGKPSLVLQGRQKLTSATLNANIKDKDDLAADEEMRRLSTKRKDVDTAAKESEAIKNRALAREAISPAKVLSDRNGAGLCIGGGCLNVFERGEIVDFEGQGVYFTGTKACRKIVGSLLNNTPSTAELKKVASTAASDATGNHGYDDERGDYNIVLGDHLAYRYEVVDLLGKGSFGQVVRCVDHKEGGVVAIKIIRNKKRFHQQALVEVGILGRLGEWDPDGAYATLTITSSFYFRSHLCIVTPCLSINLYELIRAHNFTGFPLPLIRRMSRQLLACLCLLQRKRIIHCDLKPENILLCEARKADVRVIDFGSSCRVEEKVYTYIQSRFYRSPEVILGSEYGLGIDMWSLGCILAELWTGYPLFPGENEQEQLACIMEIFGAPDRHLVERCTRKKLFFDSVGKPRVTVSSKGRRRRVSSKTLAQVLKCEDEAFLDFVARCLRWDPDRRLRADEAVGHPFVTGLAFSAKTNAIPEEARRGVATRLRSAVGAGPTSAPAATGSPTKRKEVAHVASTPAKERVAARALPETPQTAVRMGNAGTTATHTQQKMGSPIKTQRGGVAAAALNGERRRHSSVATATLGSNAAVAASAANGAPPTTNGTSGGTGVAGTKRASNGTLLLAGGEARTVPAQQQQRGLGTITGPGGSGAGASSLAQMAARESMAAVQSGGNSSTRWRG